MNAAFDLDTFYAAEGGAGRRHQGQLDPGFQRALRKRYESTPHDRCTFYHAVDLGGGEVIPGDWDLRGHEDVYLGRQSFSGRRVLEYGPATGWLSAHMARSGASVTTLDLPIGAGPDMTISTDHYADAFAAEAAGLAEGLRGGWWAVKKALGYEAAAVYADIFDPPADLGRFDVSVFAAILGHLMHPFLALQRAAERTDEAIVVTEIAGSGPFDRPPGRGTPYALFAPSPPPHGLVHWWHLSEECLRGMLRAVGFADQTIERHSPPRMSASVQLYTVVARR